MARIVDLLNLPPGLQNDGDPFEGNPFSKEDVRHQVWKDATREAKDKLHLLRFNLLQSSRVAPEEPDAWRVKLAVGSFDIWAERYVHVVYDDTAVHDYDTWLESYANEWMKLYKEKFATSITLSNLLHDLRLRLIERIELWKSIARKFVSTQGANKMHQLALDQVIAQGLKTAPEFESATSLPKSSSASGHAAEPEESCVSPSIKKQRTGIVRKYCKENALTMADLARRLGTNTTAIYGMIKGDTSRYGPDNLDRFLKGIGVSLQTWAGN
jgi:hypothetical protein